MTYKPPLDVSIYRLRSLVVDKKAPDHLPYVQAIEAALYRLAEIERIFKEIGPLELVQGDCIHRTSPGSRQVLNSNATWAVTKDGRSGVRIRQMIEELNAALAGSLEPCATCLGHGYLVFDSGAKKICQPCKGSGLAKS